MQALWEESHRKMTGLSEKDLKKDDSLESLAAALEIDKKRGDDIGNLTIQDHEQF